jgi:hypothetical protein
MLIYLFKAQKHVEVASRIWIRISGLWIRGSGFERNIFLQDCLQFIIFVYLAYDTFRV